MSKDELRNWFEIMLPTPKIMLRTSFETKYKAALMASLYSKAEAALRQYEKQVSGTSTD